MPGPANPAMQGAAQKGGRYIGKFNKMTLCYSCVFTRKASKMTIFFRIINQTQYFRPFLISFIFFLFENSINYIIKFTSVTFNYILHTSLYSIPIVEIIFMAKKIINIINYITIVKKKFLGMHSYMFKL